ncbi:proline iminopeptidase-family hydrolase [Actinokineospora xionganensis]|uniref:Proline iminopeptidase n=1 Tax=Actinokineospora xionganensis TaxID=2684470 RepID=A0ABR7L6E8_9PSEU|nr:proline iminopeptidase-family hydrolase [Actinokineospora xionganensis]MBC6447892.1 proline iminopeptidase-family hydrolase [Actinokineospora xionganensis]
MTVEGVLSRDGMDTWYQVVGDLGGDRAPVVVCHGGPGLTHDYLSSLSSLASTGRAVVFYDQFGSGRSGHLPDAPAEFWTVPLFLRELADLVEHLGIAGGHHVLGHSWGGMLGLEWAVRRPAGLRSLIVADAFAASRTYTAEVAKLLAALPEDIRTTIERHEAADTTESAEYQDAVRAFYRRHVCRRSPVPQEVMRTLGALGADPTVYLAMAGPSEFRLTGTLRDWDIVSRLGEVAVEVLLVSGGHDEVAPAAVRELHEGLPRSRWELFEEASHMPHVEEPERFLDLVNKFLDDVESRVTP